MDAHIRQTIAARPKLVQISTAYGQQKDGSTTIPRNKYVEVRQEKPKTKEEANRPEFKTCKYTTEAIVSEGSEKGELRKVCTQADCPVHHAKKQSSVRDPKGNAEEQKRRREEALAQATGLRTLAAVVAAVPVRLMKRDLLFVVERLAALLDERRLEIVARQRGIKKAKDRLYREAVYGLLAPRRGRSVERFAGRDHYSSRSQSAERRSGTPRRHHRIQGGRGRNHTQGQAGIRREGESQTGAKAGSEGHAAKGQKSGLKAGINSGVCFGRPPFFCAPVFPP